MFPKVCDVHQVQDTEKCYWIFYINEIKYLYLFIVTEIKTAFVRAENVQEMVILLICDGEKKAGLLGCQLISESSNHPRNCPSFQIDVLICSSTAESRG